MAVRWVMAACLLYTVVGFPMPDPGRLLRVPRIYNALITSDAKLQPSRAYPYSTPVFQPLGLGPVPGFDFPDQWQAPSYLPEPTEHAKPEGQVSDSETSMPSTTTAAPKHEMGDNAKNDGQDKKVEPPLTFYPRSFGFYQPQPIISYTYPVAHDPFVYTSPFGFGHTFYKYPVLPFDAYHGEYLHPDHLDPAHKPEKTGEGKTHVKGEAATGKERAEPRSDSVGVREVEFLTDADESNDGRESADLKKAEPAEKR